ncbi:unnamed protein product, partial [Closterium sp. NIES-54]
SFSNNNLTGSIPSSISLLTRLTYLSLSNNNLTGSIPRGISVLVQLINLRIHGNRMGGSLPSSLSRLVNLVNLNLSANNLSGEIPPKIGGLASLKYLNISGTNLTCPPDNSACGVTQSPTTSFCRSCKPFCNTCTNQSAEISRGSSISSSESSSTGGGRGVSVGVIIGIVVAAVVILLLLGAILLYVRRKKSTGTSLTASDCTEFSLAEVIKATNDWSKDNQLASGAFGDVFKGVSPRDGTEWAVKRARLIDMDFQKEIQHMADKNHPNIVRLLGFAIGGDLRSRAEQVLIYEYVPNGDLRKWIDPNAERPLTQKQRLDILTGMARGVEYLHSFGIVHRDINPANVLITDSMQAKIADFGLVRMGEGTSASTTRVMGTPGYVDPAYFSTCKATTASDVYR